MDKKKGNRIRATASCLCGGVTFEIVGTLRQIINCYCTQCRKTHGLMGPYTQTQWNNVKFLNKISLKWYPSSHNASRGFCADCGASIFWRPMIKGKPDKMISISAGVLDPPTRLKIVGHIYTADMADFHNLTSHDVPHFTKTSSGNFNEDIS